MGFRNINDIDITIPNQLYGRERVIPAEIQFRQCAANGLGTLDARRPARLREPERSAPSPTPECHRKDGKVVKEGDDLMAATRYGIMMLRFASTKAAYDKFRRPIEYPKVKYV